MVTIESSELEELRIKAKAYDDIKHFSDKGKWHTVVTIVVIRWVIHKCELKLKGGRR